MPQVESEKAQAAIWGFIRNRIKKYISTAASKFSEDYIPERSRQIISDLISMSGELIQTIKTESVRGKFFFNVISDILREVAGGITSQPKEIARPQGGRTRITWLSLEELRIIKEKAQTPSLKKEFLKNFSSKNVWESIDKLSDEEVDQFLDVLISLSELQRVIEEEYKVKIDLKTLWEGFSEGLRKYYEILKEKYPEVKEKTKEGIDAFLRGAKRGWERGKKHGLL